MHFFAFGHTHMLLQIQRERERERERERVAQRDKHTIVLVEFTGKGKRVTLDKSFTFVI